MNLRNIVLLALSFILTVALLVLKYASNPYQGWEKGRVSPRDFVVSRDVEIVVDEQVHILQRDQVLIRRGDVVPESQWRLIDQLRRKENNKFLAGVSGSVLLALFLLTMFAIVAQRARVNFFADASLVNLMVILYWFGLGCFFLTLYHQNPYLAFLLNPIPLLVVLYAVFINTDIAFLMAMILASLCGFVTSIDLRTKIFFVSLLGSMLGIFSVSSKKSRRLDITRAGVLVGVGNFLLLLGFNLTHIPYLAEVSLQSIYLEPVMGALNGILCGIFALGAIPLIESLFRVPTSTRLLELLEVNQPLLQRLLTEAPGTYHHSMIVANLAEKAAEDVGADPILARAAAYYHDVGKMKRPFFFIENQMGGVNLHDTLQPSLSVLIITSHTHDGVEIGKEYHLPKVILDIMIQHHGTDLVAFFHNKAKMNESDDDLVSEEQYRYTGVKPQTKEAALIMIADSVEAASRTLLKPNPGSIESLVRRIIEKKDGDGQFSECDLTKRDLDVMAASFTKSVVSMFHARIEYPEDIVRKAKSRVIPKPA